MVKAQGTKKEMEKKELELLKKGFIVFIEPYDNKTYCLVARKV